MKFTLPSCNIQARCITEGVSISYRRAKWADLYEIHPLCNIEARCITGGVSISCRSAKWANLYEIHTPSVIFRLGASQRL